MNITLNPSNQVAPQQVRDWVEDKLCEAIFDGQYKPGAWLRQLRIANQLGVSELPVREALKKLAVDGLVEYFPNRGMRVRVFSADDVEDIYKIRTFLEGMAAYAAVEKITPEELDEPRALAIQIEERLTPEYLEEHRKLNRCFHEVIFTASHRAYLVHALKQLWMVFHSMLWGCLSATANKRTAERDMIDLEERRAIIRAIENRNVTEAERAMRQHIEDAGNRLLHILMSDTNYTLGKA